MRFILLLLILFIAAPVFAQKDQVKLGEILRATVVKKSAAKELKSKAPAQPKRMREVLEIETHKEVKR